MFDLTTMTELELLNLAYDALLERWYREHKFLETCPGNAIAEARIGIYNTKLDELHALILDRERNA